jgi:mitotic-spindle organizing protein 1
MPAEQASADVRRKAAREVIDILHEIATLLVGVYQHLTDNNNNKEKKNISDKQHQNTHLDRQQLSYCVSLIENGASPEALAVRYLFPFLASAPLAAVRTACCTAKQQSINQSINQSGDQPTTQPPNARKRKKSLTRPLGVVTESNTAAARRVPAVVGRRRRGPAALNGQPVAASFETAVLPCTCTCVMARLREMAG